MKCSACGKIVFGKHFCTPHKHVPLPESYNESDPSKKWMLQELPAPMKELSYGPPDFFDNENLQSQPFDFFAELKTGVQEPLPAPQHLQQAALYSKIQQMHAALDKNPVKVMFVNPKGEQVEVDVPDGVVEQLKAGLKVGISVSGHVEAIPAKPAITDQCIQIGYGDGARKVFDLPNSLGGVWSLDKVYIDGAEQDVNAYGVTFAAKDSPQLVFVEAPAYGTSVVVRVNTAPASKMETYLKEQLLGHTPQSILDKFKAKKVNFPPPFAHEILSVQPMSKPVGSVFYQAWEKNMNFAAPLEEPAPPPLKTEIIKARVQKTQPYFQGGARRPTSNKLREAFDKDRKKRDSNESK